MAITQDDFKKVWASTSSVPEYTFSDTDYKNGWEFVGNLPPTRAMWDELQRRNDEKMQFLQENCSMCFDSVADMKSSNLDAGQTALTKGKDTADDGFGGFYRIREKTTRDDFLNGYYLDDYINIELDDGNIAEKFVLESIPAISNIHNTDGFMQRIADIIETYTQHFNEFAYHNDHTAWDETVQQTGGKWELDCSSFVSLLLHGVTYENSRYNGNEENICDEEFFNRINSMKYRAANYMAEWAVRNGYAFYPNADYSNLEAGDVLFFNNGATGEFADNAFMHIDHVALFIDKVNNNRWQMAHYWNGVSSFYANATKTSMDKIVIVARFPFKSTQNSLENLVIHPNTEYTIVDGNIEPQYKLAKPLVGGKMYTICLNALINNAETYTSWRSADGSVTAFSAYGNQTHGILTNYVYHFVCPASVSGDDNLKVLIVKESGSASTRDATIKNVYIYEGFVSSFRDGLPAYDFNYPIIRNITLEDNIRNNLATNMAPKAFYIEHETYYEVSVVLPLTTTIAGSNRVGTMPTGIPLCRIPAIFSSDGTTALFGALQVSSNGALDTIVYSNNVGSYKYIFATGIVAK